MVKVDSVELFMDDVRRHSNPHMSETVLAGLSQRVGQGDRQARDELVTTHLYLVVRLAWQYYPYHDVELGDLIAPTPTAYSSRPDAYDRGGE